MIRPLSSWALMLTIPVAPLWAQQSGTVPGADSVPLHYVLEGTGPDTIVVLHGGPGLTLESLRPDLAPLARRHVLLYYDQRGSGYSGMPAAPVRLTAAAMVEDLEAVRSAFHLERMTLLGHSWGGGLAQLYAMAHPDRVARMVLVGPLPPRGTPYAEQYVAVPARRHGATEQARMEELAKTIAAADDPLPACREYYRLYLAGVAATRATAKRIRGDLCAGTPLNLRAHDQVGDSVFASFVPHPERNDWDWRDGLRRLEVPTLVVHGDADPLPLEGARELATTLARGRLAVIREAGHYPHAEQSAAFLHAVEPFLDSLPIAPRPR